MIAKLSKIVLVGGMVLFFLGAVAVTLGGITWGWINGPVIVAGVGLVVLIVGAVAAAAIISGIEGIVIRFALIFQALRRINAETRQNEREAESLRVVHPTGGIAISDQWGQWRHFPAGPPPGAGGSPAKEPDPEPEDDGPEIVGPLLPVLEGMNRILLIGGMGAGKTELLRHLAFAKSHQDGHVIICDSHASPTTWPDFVQVAGIGRNYAEIEGVVNHVCEELDNRYKLRSSGEEKRFEQLTLIVDELFVLNQFCDLRQQFKSLLAESRKVDIGLIVAGQSDRAGALGLTGNKDLVAGFEACVYLEQFDSGQRVGFIRAGNKKDGKYYLHPGPYRGSRGGGRPTGGNAWGCGPFGGSGWYKQSTNCNGTSPKYHNSSEYEDEKYRPYFVPMRDISPETDGESDIIDMHRRGRSLNEICKKLFGSSGGKQYGKVRSILCKYGLA